MEEETFTVMDIGLLRSNVSGSRSLSFGDDLSMSQLVASIASFGIIEPIVVRRMDADDFVVVAGQRRLAAARLLNLQQVPCVITHCSDSEALMISLTENLQRNDLGPIEKAFALRRLLDEFALTQAEIGKRVGMSQSTIAHHLRLLSLPSEVQRLIGDGALSLAHGKVLAGLEDEHEVIEAALDCVSKKKSVREFETWLSKARGKTSKRTSQESLTKRREEHELQNGLYLVIKEKTDGVGSGTIEIPYYSLDEKDWVLSALSKHVTRKRMARSASEKILLDRAARKPHPSAGP